ncbi:MAG: hypothetical protein K1X55_06530 [Chitinophagales bacterium]|nr:hypothetical protein [Chitinophagales bacterium]
MNENKVKTICTYILFMIMGIMFLFMSIIIYQDSKLKLETFEKTKGLVSSISKSKSGLVLNFEGSTSEFEIVSPTRNLKKRLLNTNVTSLTLYHKTYNENHPTEILQISTDKEIIYPYSQWQRQQQKNSFIFFLSGMVFVVIGINFFIAYIREQIRIKQTCYPVR